VLIFDDKTALDDSHSKLTDADLVAFADGSPLVSCTTAVANNACLPDESQIFQVPDAAEIGKYTPYQLNEFTFADVAPLDAPTPGAFIDFNQGYNVSNVDQVYLPIAIEPVRDPADIRPSDTGGYVFGVDPKFQKFPCTISLTDTADNKYQVTLLQATAIPSGSPPDTSKI